MLSSPKVPLLLAFLSLISTSAIQGQEPVDLLIQGGRYFDVETLTLKENRGLAIHDGKFVGIDVASKDFRPEKVLELEPEHVVLPGLVDLHAHYNVRLFKIRREEFQVMPVVYLANGATLTFTAGEYDPEGMDKLKKQIQRGEQIGPELLTSGPYYGTARRGWGRRGRTAEQIQQDVKKWAERGVAGFKAKQIRPEELKALIDAAHEQGLTVTGHLGSGFRSTVNPRDAIEMGIDRIEHFLGGAALSPDKPAYSSLENVAPDAPAIAEIIRLYVERDIWFDATLTAFGYFGDRGEVYEQWQDEKAFFTPYVREQLASRERKPIAQFEKIFRVKQKIIKAYFDAGGKITLGTDHFSDGTYLPGFGVHRELHALVRSGIPPAEALKIGTLNGATAMRLDDRYGSITQGKIADAYIIQGDPLQDIRNTRHGVYVVRNGTVHRTADLLKNVEGKLGPTNEEERSAW